MNSANPSTLVKKLNLNTFAMKISHFLGVGVTIGKTIQCQSIIVYIRKWIFSSALGPNFNPRNTEMYSCDPFAKL